MSPYQWTDPGPTIDQSPGANLAANLFEQLAPLAELDILGHLWAFCDGIYAMFQEMEGWTTPRDDGLPGWANLVDVNKIPASALDYLAQYVGVNLKAGLSDADQRTYVASLPGFDRCRPATVIAEVQTTLTGTKTVDLRERQYIDPVSGAWVSNAWRHTVITKPSETPNVPATLAAIAEQKPGPDQMYHWLHEATDYEWVKATYGTYADLRAAQPTYQDLKDAGI